MIIEVILKTGKEVKAQENLSYVDYQLSLIFFLLRGLPFSIYKNRKAESIHKKLKTKYTFPVESWGEIRYLISSLFFPQSYFRMGPE